MARLAGLLLCALLLVAPFALGSGPALTLARVTPVSVETSPGVTVHLVATLTNTGPAEDSFNLSIVRQEDGVNWSLVRSADPLVAAGGSAPVEVALTAPPEGGTTALSLRACSVASPGVCAQVPWIVTTPLVATLTLSPSYAPNQVVGGSMHVSWRDGAPVNHSFVRAREQWDTFSRVGTTAEGFTDTAGNVALVFGFPTASLRGSHTVAATAEIARSPGAMDVGRYVVNVP